MLEHDFQPDTQGHCILCHHSAHCPACNTGINKFGHEVSDSDGDFYSCTDPTRWKNHLYPKNSIIEYLLVQQNLTRKVIQHYEI